MSTLVVPFDAINAVLEALRAYHYPKKDVVFDTESLRPHIPLFVAMARFKRIPGRLVFIEAEADQVYGLLEHMRRRGMTRNDAMQGAATRLVASADLLAEAKT